MFTVHTPSQPRLQKGRNEQQTMTTTDDSASPTKETGAGPQQNTIRPPNVRKSVETLEQTLATGTKGQVSQTTAMKLPTKPGSSIDPTSPKTGSSPSTPTKQKEPEIKSTTVTKGTKKLNATPSPIKVNVGGRAGYPSRQAEASAIYKKGIENLNTFRNLRKDIKTEIKKALDRLYELTKINPVVRRLDDKMENMYRKDTTNTSTQTEENKEEKRRNTKEQENQENKRGRDDGQIIRKIEENTKLLMENRQKMEELKAIIEDQKESIEKATYANAVSSGSRTRVTCDKTAVHSVVISSENDQDTGEEVLEKVRKAVDAKEGWIKIERVRKAKDRKVLLGCKTQEERRQVKERIERAGVRLVVEEVKNKDPMLILKDVLSVHTDDDVLKALRNQNRGIFQGLDNEEGRMSVKYRKKSRKKHVGHIILTVSPTVWKRALEHEKLRIDLQRVPVEDQSPLVQCSKCLGYGHGRRYCKEEEEVCSHCGGPHLSVSCPDRLAGEPADCINCRRSQMENCGHSAFSQACPVRKKWDAIARASVSYC